jgi:hypothetical protein
MVLDRLIWELEARIYIGIARDKCVEHTLKMPCFPVLAPATVATQSIKGEGDTF